MRRFVGMRPGAVTALGWSGSCCAGTLHVAAEDQQVDAHHLDGMISLKMGDRIFRVERLSAHRWRVNGRELDSRVLTELEHRFAGFGAGQADESAQRLEVPMPGRIVRILVRPGEEVVRGQGLVIVEAMKMENELKSPSAAVIQAIRVQEGQSVEKGTVLLDFVK